MSKYLVALAIAGAISGPVAAQNVPQPEAEAVQTAAQPTQPAQPQMVKKCRRVPDYQASGTMLGPSHQECKMVPAKGSTASQQGGETSVGGKK